MLERRVVPIALGALLLALLPHVAAHGDEHNAETMDIGHHEAPKISPAQNEAPKSYWSLNEHVALMYWHIGLEILAWVVILPIAVMFSIARSRFTLFSQFAFLAVNALALVLGLVYNHSTPDLYENDSHGKIGWIFTWIASAWVFMALIQTYTGRFRLHAVHETKGEAMTAANMARYQRVQEEEDDLSEYARWSNDSGQGTERNSASLYSHSRSPSVESENQAFVAPNREYAEAELDDGEKRGFLKNTKVDKFLARNVAKYAVGRTLKVIRFVYVVFERTMLIQAFVAIMTGIVVYGGIGKGNDVFNVLAHFIKGGIFFLYGLLTLGRWMGAFADFGWAWNVKPPKEVVGRRKAALPSAEFTESFVIWLYGVTNVFLEHLAAWGDAWTAQDLEHVSISVMFFGGGLLGMIVESAKIRELLNNAVASTQALSDPSQDSSWQQPKHYKFSMNPLPALIIMLLGKMMSSHHQDSMLSSMIHGQWGTMFMGFAMMRIVTYVIIYLSPPTSYLPSRPPTEILTSFCLIAGGITFILSNKDTVAALESYNLDAMFTFTVTMGLTCLLMAWTTVSIAIKGWAQRKDSQSTSMKIHAGVLV